MLKSKNLLAAGVVVFFLLLAPRISFAYSEGVILKKGMTSPQVTELQQDLKTLGVFWVEPTGYFGDITRTSVIRFQERYGLTVDGVAGPQTISQINRLLDRTTEVSRGTTAATMAAASEPKRDVELLSWFGNAENIFSIGSVANVIDVDTGRSFKAQRTYGYNHADVEALTAEDTAIMKDISGGYWNWVRRAVIVEVDGHRIAASMAPMPHAGRDDQPTNAYVYDRSDGYGYGENLDAIHGNNMDGHFDIHFLNSRTHGTNVVNAEHQAMIKKASESGM